MIIVRHVQVEKISFKLYKNIYNVSLIIVNDKYN